MFRNKIHDDFKVKMLYNANVSVEIQNLFLKDPSLLNALAGVKNLDEKVWFSLFDSKKLNYTSLGYLISRNLSEKQITYVVDNVTKADEILFLIKNNDLSVSQQLFLLEKMKNYPNPAYILIANGFAELSKITKSAITYADTKEDYSDNIIFHPWLAFHSLGVLTDEEVIKELKVRESVHMLPHLFQELIRVRPNLINLLLNETTEKLFDFKLMLAECENVTKENISCLVKELEAKENDEAFSEFFTSLTSNYFIDSEFINDLFKENKKLIKDKEILEDLAHDITARVKEPLLLADGVPLPVNINSYIKEDYITVAMATHLLKRKDLPSETLLRLKEVERFFYNESRELNELWDEILNREDFPSNLVEEKLSLEYTPKPLEKVLEETLILTISFSLDASKITNIFFQKYENWSVSKWETFWSLSQNYEYSLKELCEIVENI